MLFVSCHLQDFFLFFFSFQMFGCDLSWFCFFGFILLSLGGSFFSVLYILCFNFYQFWKGFKHFWTIFSVPSFSFWETDNMIFRSFVFVPQVSESDFFFFNIYFLLYRLDKCFLFEFTDSFFCFLHSAVQFICRFKYILF